MPRFTQPTVHQLRAAIDDWRLYGQLDPLEALLDRVALAELPRLDLVLRDALSSPLPVTPLFTPERLRTEADWFIRHPSLLAVLASHPSGHVRELAVRLLAQVSTSLATGLLLVRLNDWVAPVRRRAEEALSARLSVADLHLLLPNLPLVLRLLQEVRAPNLELVLRVLALLDTPAGLQELAAAFPGLNPATRLTLARQVLTGDAVSALLIRLFLDDPGASVRLAVIGYLPLEALPPLLDDTNAQVRATVLSRLLRNGAMDELRPLLLTALLDPREAVRLVAGHALQGQGVDLRQTLLEMVLATLPGDRLPGWLAALSAHGRAEDAVRAESFASHSRTQVRVEALHALGRLNARRYVDLLAEGMLGSTPVSQVASRALEQADLLTPGLLDGLWQRASTLVQQGRLITLGQRLGRFEAAALLLGWQASASPALLERMDETVARLLAGHGRSYYTAPPAGLLLALRARARQLTRSHPLARLSTELTGE
ncbi:hypothetical protein [Deinococcus sp. UYEF24]